MTKEEAFLSYEKMGEPQVRATALSYSQPFQGYAFEWLKLQAAEVEARGAASQAEIARYARVAKTAAVIAAISAVVAIPIAIIAIIVSYLAWQHPMQ